MEINEKEIKEISLINENSNFKENPDFIEEEYQNSDLKEIFMHKDSNKKIIFLPILLNSKNLSQKLILIFSKKNLSTKQNIINKINLFKKIIEIIGNSYEIMNIIIIFLEKNNIYPIKDIIDIYILLISSEFFKERDEKINYINDLKNIIIWFISSGLLNKNHTDYIFQGLAKIQQEKKLTPNLFNDYLSLIELIYGKNFNYSIKKSLIAKNYLYFYDKESSMIKANISKINSIFIKDNCYIIIWFYLKENMDIKESNLCRVNLNKIQEENNNQISFVLNNNDIDIKINSKILKELDGKKFNIKKNVWTQLKIQMMKNEIKLYLYQKNEDANKNNADKINDISEYETKKFYLNNNSIMNDKKINLELYDYKIIDLSFFINYLGYIGTIIVYKSDNQKIVSLKNSYCSSNTEISKFIEEISLSNIFLIFSPSLYIKDKNKFVFMNNNITGEIENSSIDSIEEEDIKKKIDYNNVFKYSQFINNIYKIGGSANILPLFEIFYKFSKNRNNNENDDKELVNIFIKLFQLMELIIIDKPKNYLDMYYNNNNSFFRILQLFLENINEKYYKNDNIIICLLNIAKYVYNYCKENEKYLNDFNSKNMFDYFKLILFYPKIILKFSLEHQSKCWNFFENIKIIPRKELKTNDYSDFNLLLCKKCFISFFQLNNFILLFNIKYPNQFLSPDLINIIKKLFLLSETTDLERESLLLLINNKDNKKYKSRISDKIIISILEIFNSYLDSNNTVVFNNSKKNDDIKMDKNDKKDNIFSSSKFSLETFLNSENYFIENLLRILSTHNLNLKNEAINLIKIISVEYTDTLKNYFEKVEIEIKKSRKIKKINKITGKEFFHFIQENISSNPNNNKIREKLKLNEQFNKNINEENKKKRKTSMDSLNLIIKTFEVKNNQIIITNNNNSSDQNKPINVLKREVNRSKTKKEKGLEEIKGKLFRDSKTNLDSSNENKSNFKFRKLFY